MELSTENSYLETQGVKRNRDREFIVTETGAFWYDLLNLLIEGAEKSEHYTQIRRYVLIESAIRDQLKTQGF